MCRRLVLLCFLFIQAPLFAQYFETEKALEKKVAEAGNDSTKVKALGDLAEFYYIYRAEAKGDIVLNHQLILAELSINKNLIVETLFGNALTYIGTWTSIETFDKAIGFLNKGLQFTQELNNPEYEVLAHIRKANILKKRGHHDNAIQQATMAFSSINNIKNDSLKSVLFLALSDI